MRFLGRIVKGPRLVLHAIRVLLVYPQFLVPLGACWVLCTLLFIGLAKAPAWSTQIAAIRMWAAFSATLALAFVLSAASHISLEMIQHVEQGERPSLARAVVDAIGKNLIRSFPVVLAWAFLWFFLTAFDLLLGEEDDHEPTESTANQAVRTIAGDFQNLSLSRPYLRALNKTIRMTVFLILPAIAWDDEGPIQASRRGLAAVQSHPAEFTSRLVTSDLVLTFVLLPLFITLGLVERFELILPVDPTIIGITYLALVWSFVF